MLYSTCPTCGYFLGNVYLQWETESANICNNPKLNNEQKEKELQKLVMSLKIRRYCCRMRIMTYKDIVQDILPVPKDV
jgi:DNA-directed RNA polymerase subunit N (RpoN/RPB10)